MKSNNRLTTICAVALCLITALGPALPAASDGWWPNSRCSTKHTTASAANYHAWLLNASSFWRHGFHVHQWGDGYFRCHQRS